MISIQRRLEGLEALPAPIPKTSPEEEHRRLVDEAAACGLSEADVEAKFGGWSGFVYGRRITRTIRPLVPDPEDEAADARFDAWWTEQVALRGGDAQAASSVALEMLRRPWPPTGRT